MSQTTVGGTAATVRTSFVQESFLGRTAGQHTR